MRAAREKSVKSNLCFEWRFTFHTTRLKSLITSSHANAVPKYFFPVYEKCLFFPFFFRAAAAAAVSFFLFIFPPNYTQPGNTSIYKRASNLKHFSPYKCRNLIKRQIFYNGKQGAHTVLLIWKLTRFLKFF